MVKIKSIFFVEASVANLRDMHNTQLIKHVPLSHSIFKEVQGDDGDIVRIDVHNNDENYNKCDNGSGNNNNISGSTNNIINARSEEQRCRIIENENAHHSHHSTSAMLTSNNRDHLNYHHHLHHHHNKSIVHSEKFKAALTFLLLVLSFFCALISLALTHDRIPDRNVYKPLPDAVLDGVASLDFLLNIAEIQIIVIVNVCILLVFFHKHRWVRLPNVLEMETEKLSVRRRKNWMEKNLLTRHMNTRYEQQYLLFSHIISCIFLLR